MPWITSDDVEILVQTDLSSDPWIVGVIDHAEGLIEAEIGAQDENDLPAGLTAVATQVAARLWRAGKAAASNPAGNAQDTLGPHSFTAGQFAAGWGLTKGELKQLGRFRSSLWIQPLTVGGTTEPPPGLIDDAAGGDQILYFHADDMPAQ